MRILFIRQRSFFVFNLCVLALAGASEVNAQEDKLQQVPAIVDRVVRKTDSGKITRGKFRVFENRETQVGKVIHLDFVVLHATSEQPRPDPYFMFAGGPGQAVATMAGMFENHWVRKSRDIVLINQRGTGGDNRLAFEIFESGEASLQSYLDSLWKPEIVRANRERLSKDFDLTMYSTPTAMDDINDFRKAMGYEKINIAGGSYGTRACLVYLRRHGDTVRSAILAGCAPIEFRNPLYHAESGQRALDLIFDRVENNPKYREAFGDLRAKFELIESRLKQKPAEVKVRNQSTGKLETVQMTRDQFMAAVRLQMYYSGNSRRLPRLLCNAHQGDFRPFVLNSLQQSMGLRRALALGMLLCVTTAEDLARINQEDIEPATRDTFLGDRRVLEQKAAAALWPKSKLPKSFGEPVESNVPTLVLSGLLDPVTPPKWGEKIHENFPNSVHLIIPTAHDIGGPCVDKVKRRFLEAASVKNLDTSCVEKMKLPELEMPSAK